MKQDVSFRERGLLYLYRSMNKAYLLLGSNLGDRESYLSQAIELLNTSVGTVLTRSSVYSTAPWPAPLAGDKKTQDDFLNQVLLIETPLTAHDLLEKTLRIEEKLGRKRNVKWEARTIDIDILLYNSEIIHTENLTIPHPFLHERRFALIPLAEIAGNYTHPILKKTIKNLLEANTDTLKVGVFKTAFL